MIIKKYHSYLTKLLLKNIFVILLVFIFLSFFLNIFEEIKYYENPIILTILNIPSIVFEILPFIFLLGVMFFFINLFDKDEIQLLRSNGIDNFKITAIITLVSLFMGIILIFVYYFCIKNFEKSPSKFISK